MRILVTGGTGFVGRNLIAALRQRGHHVRALARSEAACRKLALDGIECARGDLKDESAVGAACEGVDAVYHLGALSAAWGPSVEFHAVNVGGTAHVLAGCRQRRVRRLIHVSSPSVVFRGRDQHQIDESAPYADSFLCTYSKTKKIAEEMVRDAGQAGLATVIVRPKAVFGPGDTSLLPKLLATARAGRLPQIGDGANRVDLTYVDNVSHALVLALEAPEAVGKTYFITNGEHPPLWEVIRAALEMSGAAVRLRRVPYPVAYAMAAAMECRARLFGGEPPLTRYLVAILGRTQTYDIGAARRDLGYEAQVSVAEGIRRTIAAYAQGPGNDR